jgi:hypothetical protein
MFVDIGAANLVGSDPASAFHPRVRSGVRSFHPNEKDEQYQSGYTDTPSASFGCQSILQCPTNIDFIGMNRKFTVLS